MFRALPLSSWCWGGDNTLCACHQHGVEYMHTQRPGGILRRRLAKAVLHVGWDGSACYVSGECEIRSHFDGMCGQKRMVMLACVACSQGCRVHQKNFTGDWFDLISHPLRKGHTGTCRRPTGYETSKEYVKYWFSQISLPSQWGDTFYFCQMFWPDT